MKLGQTSFVVFTSNFVGSILGFFATLYFARTLGAGVFGTYTVVIALIFWLELAGTLGLTSAVTKRISEGEEEDEYFTAGALSIATLGVLLIGGLLLAREYIEAYVGAPVTLFIVLLFAVRLFYTLVNATLTGERLVHVAGISQSLKIGTRSVVQIVLVVVGFELAGLLLGYAVGGLIIGIAAILFASIRFRRPRMKHVRSLVEYARFSWLGQLKTRSFNEVDILVLNAFVSPSLVGIYAVAWSIANFLTLFGNALSNTLFPEISRLSAEADENAVVGLVEEGLTYAGLILIPGFVGGLVLSNRLLRVYGSTFTKGTTVMALLILACLLYAYQQQLLTALNAMDRPDMAFRINVVFILANTSLNVLLVWYTGWVGAAVATVISTAIGMTISFAALRRVIDIQPPVKEVFRQVIAALLMGGVLWVPVRELEAPAGEPLGVVATVGLITLGALIYFIALFVISARFRETVLTNLPSGVTQYITRSRR